MNGNVMEGITVLNEIAVSGYVPGGVLLTILGVVGILFCVIMAIVLFYDKENGAAITMLLLMMVCCGALCAGIDELIKPTETHYQVIIDDSVPVNEFFERYEVIEQNGKIYTVRERND